MKIILQSLILNILNPKPSIGEVYFSELTKFQEKVKSFVLL